MKIELSLVIPCYNEENNIPLIVKRFKEKLPKDLNAELILVDNGSIDNTGRLIEKFSKKNNFVKFVKVKKNNGYGFGIYTGLKTAKGEYVSFTHGDMQTDPYDAVRAYEIIKKFNNPKKCLVKGSRRRRSYKDKFFEIVTSVIESCITRTAMWDVFAIPSLFHKDFLKLLKDPPMNYAFDVHIYYLSKKNKFRIIRLPVLFKKRMYGKSHWNRGIMSKLKFLKILIISTKKIKNTIDIQIQATSLS